ncbi:hypothetical protein Hanom_Chr00s000910g01670161 [Helianthus anomalus]
MLIRLCNKTPGSYNFSNPTFFNLTFSFIPDTFNSLSMSSGLSLHKPYQLVP